ncbi:MULTISPECIES: hypothetical protein [unclassified Nitratireductor]|uniref:hypothetical protein n=1 Tax=unclassified Nitratireductor TaxID=2641084 RepID=UPI0025FA4227|nr:hypothetical protein [Nitratireductor sp.]
MTIYGVPIADVAWTTWWMLGSAAITFIGFIGWKISSFFTGAKAMIEQDAAGPRYSWLRARILPGYLANQPFKSSVLSRQLQGGVSRFFFYLLLAGLAGQVGFWLFAISFMQQ